METKGAYLYFDVGQYPDGTRKLVPVAILDALGANRLANHTLEQTGWPPVKGAEESKKP